MSTPADATLAPRVVERPDHTVSRSRISEGALKVLYRLHRSGYLAYLVGGSVRDLLLGREPKDFDVATNARPSELRRLFRNSRIIGRRFRLAHVMFSGEIVEVSTFRASPEPPELPEDWEEPGEDELVREESPTYGTPAEDAVRRDLTINALFYNIADFSVIDYVGGLDDLDAGIVRTIGTPEERFVEDPVRMMRALEYAARLSFTIEDETGRAIEAHASELGEAAPARLTYEVVESLRSGSAAAIFRLLDQHGVLEVINPVVAGGGVRLWAVLEALDRRLAEGAALHDAVLVGSLYLPEFEAALDEHAGDDGKIDNPALIAAIADLLEPKRTRMQLSNYVQHLIQQGLFTLSKLLRPPARGRQVVRLARQDYFPVAWELFTVWAASGGGREEAWDGWRRALERLEKEGSVPDPDAESQQPTRRRSRRRRRRGGRRR